VKTDFRLRGRAGIGSYRQTVGWRCTPKPVAPTPFHPTKSTAVVSRQPLHYFPQANPRLCRGGSRSLTVRGVSICCNLTVSTRPLTATPLPSSLSQGRGKRGEGVKG
jgi:hypothetical protein